jgi:hypothetical protein
MRRDGTVLVMEHDTTKYRKERKSVTKDEVEGLISDHLAFNHTNPEDNESVSASEETESVMSDDTAARAAKKEMVEKYGDYKEFEEEQAKHKDITNIIMDIGMDKAAQDELKRRSSLAFNMKHPGQAEIVKKVPALFVAAYPNRATDVKILDYNNYGTYYIACEEYGNGHGLAGRFGTEGFTIYTVRDTTKHRVTGEIFCLSPRGPAHCPVGASCIEPPWWEIRGKGDKVVKGVDGNANVVDVVMKGEKATKTGRLCVRMPGEHVLCFQGEEGGGGREGEGRRNLTLEAGMD